MRITLVDDVVTSLRTGAEALFREGPQRLMVLVVCALLMLGHPGVARAEPGGLSHPVLSGSFIQPYLLDEWSDAELDSELRLLLRAGIDEVILQWTSDSGRSTTVHPTSLLGFSQSSDTDVVERLLGQADQLGIAVHLGLQVNDEWWNTYADDQQWLDHESQHSRDLADELWAAYGHHESIAGWYLPFEVDNHNFLQRRTWDAMAGFYADTVTHLRGVHDMTISTSPFYNTDGGMDPDGWEEMWAHILRRADLDIIALQDGVGAGHARTEDLAAWFSATRSAIDRASPQTRLFADTETFNPDFSTMPIGEVVANMRAVEASVSTYWSFSYDHYTSPLRVSSAYDTTYRDYRRSGTVETTAPTAPRHLVVTAQDHQSVSVSWTASTDDTGVAGYFVMRDGKQVMRVDGTADCGAFDRDKVGCPAPVAPTNAVDDQLSPGTRHEYAVVAFDGAGNLSGPSAPVSVVLPEPGAPVLVSAGAAYTCSSPASRQYPDGGTKLTDGVLGSTSFTDPAWTGRLTNEPFSCVVDLGSPTRFSEVTSRWLQDPGVGIVLPSRIDVEASLTGKSYRPVGTLRPGTGVSGVQAVTYRLAGVEEVTRFLRIVVTPRSVDGWSFTDEFEVRGPGEGGDVAPAPSDPVPSPTTPPPTPTPDTSPTTAESPSPPTMTPTAPQPSPTPSATTGDLYSTPGYHDVNGRRWHTTCEPYSQTTRCRTDIWSTHVTPVTGGFVSDTGWHFNNLTYLPEMTRSQWGDNSLANSGKFASAGRAWKTECDTAATGRNGCRSHIWSLTVAATPRSNGGYAYAMKEQWVFNNIVLFKG